MTQVRQLMTFPWEPVRGRVPLFADYEIAKKIIVGFVGVFFLLYRGRKKCCGIPVREILFGCPKFLGIIGMAHFTKTIHEM